MRVRLVKPTPQETRALLRASADAPFSYTPVGASRTRALPDGFQPLHHRQRLPNATFESAVSALKAWQFFPDWVEATADGELREGALVSVISYAVAVWTHNICRVVYVIDEPGRYGFGCAPIARAFQRRFLRDSAARLSRAMP